MNVYKELVEIDEMKEKNSDLKDKILDYYNNMIWKKLLKK
jgi:hypothetical protein